MPDDTNAKWDKLKNMGITIVEIQAFVIRLKIELGNDKEPTTGDVADFALNYLRWREDEKRIAAGEMVVSRILTEKGENALRVRQTLRK